MNQKNKNNNLDSVNCEKYLSRVMRLEKYSGNINKRPPANALPQRPTSVGKHPPPVPPSQPPKSRSIRQSSPVMRQNSGPPVQTIVSPLPDSNMSSGKESTRPHRERQRSATGSDRDTWGLLLLGQRSKDKVSSFSNFDPLRTLHFLSRELHIRLQGTLPDDSDALQMITDIQHALKRIPPEVASVIHLQQASELQVKHSSRSISDLDKPEKLLEVIRPIMLDNYCQTPPNFSQEDTEKLQKIMEESTLKLEISCKQLEMLCSNLQNENDSLEKQLEEERNTVGALNEQVAELQAELDEVCNQKLQCLEEENHQLKKEIQRLSSNAHNPAMNRLKEKVTELEKQRAESNQKYTKLQYDLTLATMEKEKFITMLAVRDREIKEIHEEMARVQEEVGRQLAKLNGDVASRVSSGQSISAIPSSTWNVDQENKEHQLTVGDSTISSIATNDVTVKGIEPGKLSSGDGASLILKRSNEHLQKKVEPEKLVPHSG